ncbi:MAG: hypothetical protein ACOH2M_12470 [Cypionkella sp.]
MRFVRLAVLGFAVALLSACQTNDLKEPPPPLGDFVLGLNIVVADNVQKVPISRDADPKDWEASVKKAVADRFGRYDGNRIYNIGISIDAYALAPPGIPLVVSPKSVLVVTANIWDDATATKLNPEGKQLTIFEHASPETLVGSGLTQNKKQQMTTLSYNAAKAVEKWLVSHPEWFNLPPLKGPRATAAEKAAVLAVVAAGATKTKAPAATAPVAAPKVPAPKPATAPVKRILPPASGTSSSLGATVP